MTDQTTEPRTVRISGDLRRWGLILDFIDPTLDTPMWQQVHDNYGHGGGWNDFTGFEITSGGPEQAYTIQYPDDPHYNERSRIQRGDEHIVIFDYSWVLWSDGREHDTQYKIARID